MKALRNTIDILDAAADYSYLDEVHDPIGFTTAELFTLADGIKLNSYERLAARRRANSR